ncbi:MAG: hypothetical protein GC154_11515 [bacterium]|nr:hypothetical protein [bacterium]
MDRTPIIGRQLAFSLGLILAGWFLFAGCSSDQAALDEEEEPLQVGVIAGFDPEYPFRRAGEWVSLNIELKNNGKAIKGDFLVQLKDGNLRYRVPIDLAPQNTAAFSLPVHTPDALDELEFYIETSSQRIPVEIITVGTMLDASHRIIAIMSDERGQHGYIDQDPEAEIDLIRQVLYTSPDILPRWWPGYRSLDALIWDGGTGGPLSARQQEALDHWIQMGGTLVLAAGDKWQELNNSPFRLYVPMTLNGSKAVDPGAAMREPGVDTPSVKPELSQGLVIATGALEADAHATTRLTLDDAPFLVERRWGAGRIIFVASSLKEPIFSDADLQETFLQFITDSAPAINPQTIGDLDSYATSYLRWSIQAELPSTTFIAMYLGLYIILVAPVNYLLFKRIGRLEWAWFTVPVWAVVFAVGVYYIGALRQQSQVAVNEISVIEARPGAGMAPAITYASVYSPVRQWYNLEFSSPVAFPMVPETYDYRTRRNEFSDEILNVYFKDGSTAIRNYLIHHWSNRIFKSLHTVELGDGVEIEAELSGPGIKGKIINNTGMALMNPTLVAGGMQATWVSADPGETLDIAPEASSMIFDANRWNNQMMYPNFNQQMREDPSRMIRDNLSPMYSAKLMENHQAEGLGVFTAEINQPQLTFDINGKRVEPRGNAMLCVVFPFRQNLRGSIQLTNQDLIVTAGFIRSGNSAMNQAMFGGNNRMYYIQRNTTQSFALRCSKPLQGGVITNMMMLNNDRMNMRMNRPGVVESQEDQKEYELMVRDQVTKQYKPLSDITQPNGSVIEPDRYVNKQQGLIECQMTAPSNMDRQFMLDTLQFSLTVDFSANRGRFLGRPIAAAPQRRGPDSNFE